MATSPANTVLFAGGGTGGHIFPNMAVAERLKEMGSGVRVHFLISDRPFDAQVMRDSGLGFTVLAARPWSWRPWHWPAFFTAWRQSVAAVGQLIEREQVVAVVATGGFVSAPALWAARFRGKGHGAVGRGPVTALVNLDAVPGRANRLMARQARTVFVVYPTRRLPKRQQRIGLPLRRCVISDGDAAGARRQMGLDPQRHTLLVTGASQGARSINRLMMELVGQARVRHALQRWQVLHLSGPSDVAELRRGYERAAVPARVEAFTDAMGAAWGSATLAISRAGAGSVAEAWANAVPTIFLPYPHHRDQHQRHNAEPLSGTGAAIVVRDMIDARANAKEMSGLLLNLITNDAQREQMVRLMRREAPPDGAEVVAAWLTEQVDAAAKVRR